MDLLAALAAVVSGELRNHRSQNRSRHRARVAVVIPARNEESVIGEAIASLLGQDYRGDLHIVRRG